MNRRLWENLLSLYGVHMMNYVVPLITLPYVARVLGPAEWGALAFAEAYANYVALAVEYGFGLSATRQIARLRDDSEARSYQLSGVLGAQLLLSMAAILITLLLLQLVPLFSNIGTLLLCALWWAMSRAVAPMWYFQGLERMRLVASLSISANVIAAAGIFVAVRSPGDGWKALALRAVMTMIATAIALCIAYRDTPFLRPSLRRAVEALREGGSLFLFRSASSLYTTANVIILGVLAPYGSVAWFAGAEKIAKAAVSGILPIMQAFYPRLSHLLATDRRRATDTVRVSARLTMGVGLAAGGVLFVCAPAARQAAPRPGL